MDINGPKVDSSSLAKRDEEYDPEPGELFEAISRTLPSGEKEFFFRVNESDDNGSGWDFRNGK